MTASATRAEARCDDQLAVRPLGVGHQRNAAIPSSRSGARSARARGFARSSGRRAQP